MNSPYRPQPPSRPMPRPRWCAWAGCDRRAVATTSTGWLACRDHYRAEEADQQPLTALVRELATQTGHRP